MSHEASFGIQTAGQFFDIVVLPQVKAFIENNASESHAITSIILCYHMYEWVNGKKFSKVNFLNTYPGEEVVRDNLEIARKIANGNKHFLSKIKTRRQSGFSSAFDFGFQKPLVVTRDDGCEISVDELLETLTNFWNEQRIAGKFS